jgi:hypothetical protein
MPRSVREPSDGRTLGDMARLDGSVYAFQLPGLVEPGIYTVACQDPVFCDRKALIERLRGLVATHVTVENGFGR